MDAYISDEAYRLGGHTRTQGMRGSRFEPLGKQVC